MRSLVSLMLRWMYSSEPGRGEVLVGGKGGGERKGRSGKGGMGGKDVGRLLKWGDVDAEGGPPVGENMYGGPEWKFEGPDQL